MPPARLPTMPLAELDALRRRLDQAYERWFDGDVLTISDAQEGRAVTMTPTAA